MARAGATLMGRSGLPTRPRPGAPMPSLPRLSRAPALLALLAVVLMAVPAFGAADHVVIGEFSTRAARPRPTTSSSNSTTRRRAPSTSPGGSSSTSRRPGPPGTDRAVLPADGIIPAHGFFLIAPTGLHRPPARGLRRGRLDLRAGATPAATCTHHQRRPRSRWTRWAGEPRSTPRAVPPPRHTPRGNSVERKALGRPRPPTSLASGRRGGARSATGRTRTSTAATTSTRPTGATPRTAATAPEPALRLGR